MSLNYMRMLGVGLLTMGLALAGCGDDDGGDPPPMMDADISGDSAAQDAAAMMDAEPMGLPCGWPDDEARWGTMLGRYMKPLSLQRCDGTTYNLPHEGLCNSSSIVPTDHVRYVVVVMSAGWCAPCRRESEELSEFITDEYRANGVEGVQVLTATENDSIPLDGDYCNSWVATYDLDRPNFTELLDPGNMHTGRYFPGGALPANLIVDHTGILRFRDYGASAQLTGVTRTLDDLLCENYSERCD